MRPKNWVGAMVAHGVSGQHRPNSIAMTALAFLLFHVQRGKAKSAMVLCPLENNKSCGLQMSKPK